MEEDKENEDIKILETQIQACKECKFATCEQCEINYTEVQALENLIARYKEVENDKELLKQSQNDVAIWKKLYKDLKQDFEDYKNDKDINYLDNNHHKFLVEKSIGQTIDKPDECWFDQVEVKIIIDNTIYTNVTSDDFITLQEIANIFPKNSCITVIAESPLSGAIYRYNNYGKKEWQLIGIMLGYA